MESQQIKKLHQIYRRIPKINCKGLCHTYCGVIAFWKGEGEQMFRAADYKKSPGVDGLDENGNLMCNYLTSEKRCEIYEHRPAICRMYGVMQTLECKFGCEPERVLGFVEGAELMIEIHEIAGTGEFGEYVQSNATQEQFDQDLKNRSTGETVEIEIDIPDNWRWKR